MRERLESDLGFYYAVGAFVIAVFVVGLAAVALLNPEGIGTIELVGLSGGFLVFMLVYFVSVSVQQLENSDEA